MSSLPNLASRPFVNRRPVRRLALLLWLVGGLAFVANGFLYWRHLTGAGRRQDELVEIAAEAERERATLADREAALAQLDLDWQNDQVRFLNYKIAERAFPWSELFDQLTQVLPRGVRLARLQPSVARAETSRREAPTSYGEAVGLAMSGGAESGEALYAFLDALFEHPAFDRPSLARESRGEGEVEFTLTVTYLPRAAVHAEPPGDAVEAEVELPVESEPPAASPAPDGEGNVADTVAVETVP